MTDADRDELVGRQIGHYGIRRRLGKGGMGAVYLAEDRTLDRPAALKLLLDTLADQPGVIERFEREAKAAAKLSHPNIVSVYGVSLENDPPYIAMEYVEGTSLEACLQDRGPLPWDHALNIIAQVAAALDCAHRSGVVHRDIKPANILLDKDDRVRVTDFGIAKVVQAATQLTAEGTFIGTPQYMSPEQCGTGEVGPQSDLFSLGVTTYELLSGQVPFHGDTPASLVFKITSETAPPLGDLLPKIPPGIEALVSRLMAKKPGERYQSATDLLADIERIRRGENIAALAKTTPAESPMATKTQRTAPRTPPPTGASKTRRRGLLFGVGAVVIVLVIGAIYGYARSSRENTKKTPQPDEEMPLIDEFFATNDANGDGVITGDEMPPRFRRMLVLADTDGSVGVSRAEMEQVRDKLIDLSTEGDGPNPRRIRQPATDPVALLRRYDNNRDQQLTAREVPEHVRPRLLEADADGDGAVSLDELRRSARRENSPPR